ncbi:MAG TPA: C4-type zinc ribbon domain-containing protein [Deinococcales bacterium]|nr:C4-type zinc ribbon domain-containing protein [Deinococcales bacterium]
MGSGQEAVGSLAEALKLLSRVQVLDLEADRLEQEEASIPGELKNAREERVRLSRELSSAQEEHEAVRKKVSSADLELRDFTAKRDRAQGEQRTASSAKEQAQLENVIQQLSGRIEELEDSSLPQVERMETLAADVARLKGELEELAPRLAHLEGMDEDRIAGLRLQREEFIQERGQLAGSLDQKVLHEYDHVRKAKRGVGLAALRGNRCGACNVQVPLNVQQRVKVAAGIVKCPACGRILWSGDK